MAGLQLIAVHFELAVWFVSLASVQLADGLFVCCVVASCRYLARVLMVYLCDVFSWQV